MPAKHKPFTIYLDDTAAHQVEDLRKDFQKKQGGVEISDSYMGRALINEKHIELVDKQNNRARITDIVNQLAKLTAEVNRLSELIEREKIDGQTG